MNEQSLSKLRVDLGYDLLSPPHPDSPGYGRLLVAIRKQPTGKHFDPEVLYLPLRDAQGQATWTKISQLTLPADSYHVCPGRVILSDRFDKRIEFFSFGGSLEAIREPDEMIICLLRSAAPILELTCPEETFPDQLAAGTESLMAGAHAQWGRDDRGFSQRLAAVDPFEFYLASLHSNLLHQQHIHALDLADCEFRDALDREKHWLAAEGLWPANPPILEDLLAPD